MIPKKQNAHLLIVDDDQAMRSALRRSLEKMGHVITSASNGKEALAIITKQHIDLVLMDFRMPKMDGLETLKIIRNKGFTTPVIIMTAFGDVQLYLKSKELGIAEFIIKPVSMNKLKEIIRTVLQQYEGGTAYQSA